MTDARDSCGCDDFQPLATHVPARRAPPPSGPASPPASSATSSPRRAYGATAANPNVLVVLSLRGGADGLSMVVPHGDPGYAAARDADRGARPASCWRRTRCSACTRPSSRCCRCGRPARSAPSTPSGCTPPNAQPLRRDGGGRGRRPRLGRAARLDQPDRRPDRRRPAAAGAGHSARRMVPDRAVRAGADAVGQPARPRRRCPGPPTPTASATHRSRLRHAVEEATPAPWVRARARRSRPPRR